MAEYCPGCECELIGRQGDREHPVNKTVCFSQPEIGVSWAEKKLTMLARKD